ncbi:hypothetical protein BGX28_005364 [Mortierella sp. GBA30]|nr:hypothetical protein BGX28_005364 [Mortierella sp. GBA30]
MAGSSRYNGPGAALRGQPRAPRQSARRGDDGYSNSTDSPRGQAADATSSRSPVDKYGGSKDLPDVASPRSYTSGPSHQRQWSDASSLQGGALPPHLNQNYPPSQNYPYSNQSPYMGPSSGGSPASPPPLSSSPSSASSYFHSADQRSHQAYPPSQRQQQPARGNNNNQYGTGSAASSVHGSIYSQYSNGPTGGGGGSRPGVNGYNSQYDQSPMMSPMSPDSWRSPPVGARGGYGSPGSHYQPSSQHHPYSTASSVVNEDQGHHQSRSGNYPYESDSDDYYNRQGGGGGSSRNASSGYGQQGRYGDDRGQSLSYSNSIASNTSSVLAARRARNERNERNQRQKAAQADEWLTSPTGTEHETEILPWSDDEAIVTKAVRSPPTGYSNEKTLPPIPYRGSPQPQSQSQFQPQSQQQQISMGTVNNVGQSGNRMESDMIKVEVGGTTSVIPTTEDGSGLTFVKSVPGSTSPPPMSRYNTAVPTPVAATQSMTGAATSLRAAAVFNEQKAKANEVMRQDQKRLSSDWEGQRISLDDMLSTSSPVARDGRQQLHQQQQQAIDSWRTSPPLRAARDESSTFTDLKSKRRSSLPDKFVPDWNDHAQNWRSSIGQQRRPSWMASSKGAHTDQSQGKENDLDDFMAQKKKWADHGVQNHNSATVAENMTKEITDTKKRLSDQSSLHRRSRSWSPRPDLSRGDSARSRGKGRDGVDHDLDKDHSSSTVHRRDSFASTISRSRSRSHSRSRSRSRPRVYDRQSHRSYSLSRSRSRSRSRSVNSGRTGSRRHSHYDSRSRPVSRSRSRSRSPVTRAVDGARKRDASLEKDGQDRSSSARFSWQSTSDVNPSRRSWDSMAQETRDTSKVSKAEGNHRADADGEPRYSTAAEEDVTDYDNAYSDKKLGTAGRGTFTMRDGPSNAKTAPIVPVKEETKPSSFRRDEDSDADSLDSPPVKVQYARSSAPDGDDDDQSITSKYPASIISTFNLPPATSPTSPHVPPPLPTPHNSAEDGKTPPSAGGRGAGGAPIHDYMNYKPMVPPPVPTSPPQSPNNNNSSQSLMTSVTTVSIEAATATLSSSRVSVDSFKNVPGTTGASGARGPTRDIDTTDADTDFETDTARSPSYKREKPTMIQPSFVSMTTTLLPGSNSSSHAKIEPSTPTSSGSSSAQTSNPISISTNLTRTESSASSASVLSARSAKSFMSSSSIHSASSSIPSPPPQRAPPPIPVLATDAAGNSNGNGGRASSPGPGLINGAAAKRSGSGGSARGVRSGLSRQILPPAIAPPLIPPPEVPSSGGGNGTINMGVGSKPSYGILPPPIPSSFTEPSSGGVGASTVIAGTVIAAAAVAATTSSAVQIQMLADEDQSRSQMGAITVENDERLLTKLNNRVAQLERELEFAQQDLEASQDDAVELQNKVQDLEAEIEELSLQLKEDKALDRNLVQKEQEEKFESAKESWNQERAQLLEDLERLREDHQAELKSSLKREQSRHEEEVEFLTSEHKTALEAQRLRSEEERDFAREEQSKRMEELELRLQVEHQEAMDDTTDKLRVLLSEQHAEALEGHRSEHEAKFLENHREWEERLESALEEHTKSLEALQFRHQEEKKDLEVLHIRHQEEIKDLEALQARHQEEMKDLEVRMADLEKVHAETVVERDQAFKDLGHHKKETEQALDRLETVLAEDKKTHAQLIQDLEQKAKGLEARVLELEAELQEVLQDNVKIVEEMERREDAWAQERVLLRSSEGDLNEQEARLQEMHEQIVALTESKRQADAQFQGIVKGLLREASANKKELEARQELLDQEKQGKEEVLQQLEAIQSQIHALELEKGVLLQEKNAIHQERETLHQEKETLHKDKQSLQQEMHMAVQSRAALEESHRDMEVKFENQQRSGSEAMMNIQRELEDRLRDKEDRMREQEGHLREQEDHLREQEDRLREQEQALEAERSKVMDLEEAMEQSLSKAGKDIQQEQFVWKNRLDQVEAALKTKEAQVRKLEQDADATMKIQNDLLQSMERDAANSQKKLEASLLTKMQEREQAFEEEKKNLQLKIQQELIQRFEQDSIEKENSLQQQLDSIHQQELTMALQELSTKHEQQLRIMKQQHESALEQSGMHFKQQSQSIEDQFEKLQQQAEQERSEKEVALKDRTFLERRMAGHDRRQKELEMNLESLQQELDQARAKFGQDLQDVERSKTNLERKLGMAREDVEELNKIRDELENDRDELRQELHRLKRAGPSRTSASSRSSAAESAAWEAEKRRLEETVRKLEDEVQIMLEKNMNLTIELSMNYIALRKVPPAGPNVFQRLHNALKKYTPWQILIGALTTLYAAHHADLLLGLTPAEPEKKMFSRRYTPGYTRGLWIFSALDAGFFTSQNIRPKVLRDTMSAIFSVFYLFFPKRAVEKNNIMLKNITATHMRRSWEKMQHPIIRAMTWVNAPRLGVRKEITVRLSLDQGYHSDATVKLTIFFVGSEDQLATSDALILDVPGGGFVAMNPLCHADYLMYWAAQTKVPIVSIDYKKAPEHPFPFGLNECFDVYKMIVSSKGTCIGLNGRVDPRIALAGDSAGGTLATSVINKIIEHSPALPRPVGLLLVYPCMQVGLDFWISNDDLAVVEEEVARGPIPSDTLKARPGRGDGMTLNSKAAFLDDQVLGSSFLRALMVMYIGADPTLDHKSDYLVSPLHTPDHILAQYPRTYIVTGEKDPLVDDSIIFMAKLRRAKRAASIDLESDTLRIVSGVSHAFLQMTGIVPEMKDLVRVAGEELSDMIKLPKDEVVETWGDTSLQSLNDDEIHVHVRSKTVSNPRQVSEYALAWEQENTRDAVTIYEHRRVAYLDQLGIDTHDE